MTNGLSVGTQRSVVRRRPTPTRPSLRAKAKATSNTTTASVVIPSSAVPDVDFGILSIATHSDVSITAAPAGWTKIYDTADDPYCAILTVQVYAQLRIYTKTIATGDPGASISFTLSAAGATSVFCDVYKDTSGIGTPPRAYCAVVGNEVSLSKPKNVSTIHCEPNDLVVGISSCKQAVSTALTASTLTTAPTGYTIQETSSYQRAVLQQTCGLALYDGVPNTPSEDKTVWENQNAAVVNCIFSLKPVGTINKAGGEYGPPSLAGQPCWFYGNSYMTYLARPASVNDPWRCTFWPWHRRVKQVLASSGGNNFGVGGACAEDVCSFAFGTGTNRTQGNSADSGDVVNVVQAGTWMAQSPRAGVVFLDLMPNNYIGELTPNSQVRDGAKLAAEALIRLLRADTLFNDDHASVAYAGTWTTPTSTGYAGGAAKQTTVPGSKATITTSATAIDLVLIAQDDAIAGAAGSTYSITVDGGTPITGTVSNRMKATGGVGTAPNYGFVQMTVPLELGVGSHTIEVEHTGTSGQILRFDGYMTRAATPPWIVCNLSPLWPDAQYVSNIVLATQELYDQYVKDIAALFTDGRVMWYDPKASGIWVRDTYKTSGVHGAGGAFISDQLHHNDVGAQHYAREILRLLTERIP